MFDFFKLQSSSEVYTHYQGFAPLVKEKVTLADAHGRVLAEDIISPEALPPFSRSTVDGYAVRARDTFGCSESEPTLLTVVGEIAMGETGDTITLRPGQTAQIWTGGALPEKADGVVMVEYTKHFDKQTMTIYRPLAPGENVIARGDDYNTGDIVIRRGRRLHPQDLGVLAGLGITHVQVYRHPRVAILSTGDELVAPECKPEPGQIRDINATTLSALVEEAGGIPRFYGICEDNFDKLLHLCKKALAENDMLLLSGGSSVGRRDFTLRVFETLEDSRILVHGVSIKPGKPTILAAQSNKALFGLPGHVASAMVVFYLFVRPLLHLFQGLTVHHGLLSLPAVTAEQIPSAIGKEEYVRVRLTVPQDGTPPLIHPIYGRSGLLSPLVEADGLLCINRDSEGLDRGTPCTVLLFPSSIDIHSRRQSL